MKNKIILLVLMCMIVSLTQPAWSMNEEGREKRGTSKRPKDGEENRFDLTLMGMPEKIQQHIYSFISAPNDLASLKLLNKRTNHFVNETFQGYLDHIRTLKDAADQGDAESQLQIYNLSSKRPNGKAVKWLKLVARNGHPIARVNLAFFYDAVKHNGKKAEKWLTLAANQSDQDAQYALAHWYLFAGFGGIEKEPEVDKALAWFEAAAMQGYLDAQIVLSRIYGSGHFGVAQDLDKAVEFYKLAAKQSNIEAHVSLISFYENGDLNEGNPEWDKAIPWIVSAAHLGHSYSQYLLGSFYDTGQHAFPEDLAKATTWYELSAKQEDGELARQVLRTIFTYPTDPQF